MDEESDFKVEEALDQLEEIVEELESESVDLQRSVDLFEEGVELADRIKKELEEAELQLKKVIEEADGDYSLENLEI